MKTVQRYPLRSWLLVAGQVACLVYLFTSAPWKAIRVDLQIWELSGVFLAVSGLFGLGRFSFSVFPEPRRKGRFIRSGIFAFIRHPMYAGVLVITATLVWQFFSCDRVAGFTLLTAILVAKILIEERELLSRYPEYAEYQRNTNRIIPFIW